jgi:hypothetical protein
VCGLKTEADRLDLSKNTIPKKLGFRATGRAGCNISSIGPILFGRRSL